jgi:hypothetical protein
MLLTFAPVQGLRGYLLQQGSLQAVTTRSASAGAAGASEETPANPWTRPSGLE